LTLDKRVEKNTISHKFKMDLIDTFNNPKWKKNSSVLEVSCYKGFTTNILSHLFKKVFAVDIKFVDDAKQFNGDRKNIEYFEGDVYREEKWEGLPQADVIFIDCVHTYESVKSDLEESLKHIKNDGFIILDDYGLLTDVKKAVKEFINKNGQITFAKFLGESKGSDCRVGKILLDEEGIMLKYRKGEK
tara:strand:+ start:630 stop:1193 length:564 start_codon:yes stop_codon:yes gene_type:complete